jgi:hypothetical protein
MLSRTAISGHGPVAVAESLERMFHSVRHTRALRRGPSTGLESTTAPMTTPGCPLT